MPQGPYDWQHDEDTPLLVRTALSVLVSEAESSVDQRVRHAAEVVKAAVKRGDL